VSARYWNTPPARKAGVGFRARFKSPNSSRRGSAVHDFLYPDRIVIGADDPRTAEALKALYADIDSRILVTSSRTAEMIKYASNAALATKISFANEIGNLCKTIGIDSRDVFAGVGMDSRVNPEFSGPGSDLEGRASRRMSGLLLQVQERTAKT